jgi:hypothetical protein
MTPRGLVVVALFALGLVAANTYLDVEAQEWLVLALPVGVPAAIVAVVLVARGRRGRASKHL